MLAYILLYEIGRGMVVGPMGRCVLWSCVHINVAYLSNCLGMHSMTSPATGGHDCSGTCIITSKPSDDLHVFDPHDRHLAQR